MVLKHVKTITIPDPTQANLDAQIALGNYPPGTLLTDIALPSDYNAEHSSGGAANNLPLLADGAGGFKFGTSAADVSGPASSTDNAIARFDLATGKIIQNSGVIIDDSNNISGIGTLASGSQTITGTVAISSTSASSLTVGANGATNPALKIDASTASSATGIQIKSAAAAGGVALTAISSGANESITVGALGTGNATLNGGTQTLLSIGGSARYTLTTGRHALAVAARSNTTVASFQFSSSTGAALTASTEAPSVLFSLSNLQAHNTGALTIQRDFQITAASHSFVAASTITDAAAFAVDSAPIASTNATITNSSTIYSAGAAVGAGVTNSYGLNIAANSGATNNWAARFSGDIFVTNGAIKNTRINQRVVALTDAATVTPNGDTTDMGELLTLSQATTIAAPTGTPVDGQRLMLRIKSTASQTLTFNAIYRGSTDLALPASTTGSSLTDYLGFIYNSADSKWDYLAKNFGF